MIRGKQRVAALLGLALAGGFPCGGAIADSGFNPLTWFGNSQAPTKDSDKIVKVPARPEDLDCPDVDVELGGATSRVGGAESASVRYQFNISDVARECDPQGAQFAMKIGVAGRLLIGPAGSPGSYSTALHVLVKRDIDQKILVNKTYRISADTAGADQAPYRFVTEPIMLPLTRARLDQDYSVSVGLGAGAEVTSHRRPRRRS